MERVTSSFWFRLFVVLFVVFFFVSLLVLPADAAFTDSDFPQGSFSENFIGFASSDSHYFGDTLISYSGSGPAWIVKLNNTYVNYLSFSPGTFTFLNSNGSSSSLELSYNSNYGYYGRSESYSRFSSFFTGSRSWSSAVAFFDFLDNEYVPPLVGHAASFSLPCGNVAYVQLSEVSTLSLFGTFEQWSNFHGSWNEMSIAYLSNASLPVSGTTFPLSGMSPIPFVASEGTTNILGLSKTGSAVINGSGWVCIYNPTWQQYGQGNNHDLNPTITISGSKIADIKVYPLNGSIVIGSGIVSGSDSGFQSNFTGSVDPETGYVTFYDQNGNLGVPSTGGTGYLPDDLTGASLGQAIKQILQDIVSSLENVFSVSHNAIVQLVAAGRNFVQSLTSMYAWLPSAVFTVLSSAVVIVITIGILKVFL